MFTHARWGMWETNSSSVHQVAIHIDNPNLINKPPEGLIMRSIYFDIDYKPIHSAQEKLDVLVGCIIQYNAGGNEDVIRAMANLISIIKDEDVEVKWDIDSFKQNNWPPLSDDLAEAMVNMINEEPDKIAVLLFDPTSHFAGDHNGYKYEGSESLMYESDPEYKNYEVITKDY